MAEIKRKDVDALVEKLGGFAKSLPDQEQHVLNWLMARAQNASSELSEEELEAVAGGRGMASGASLADSLGFTDDAESITVSWSKSFSPAHDSDV